MKKLLIPFVLITGFLAKNAVAQDCKYFKEGTVKATGEPFKESRNVLVKTYAFQLRKEGTSKLSCSLEITVPGTSAYSITPKDTLYLLLENEEMVKLTPDKIYAPAKKAAMNGITSQYIPTYGLTKELLEKLAASPIFKVRILMDKAIDGPAKKAESQEIQDFWLQEKSLAVKWGQFKGKGERKGPFCRDGMPKYYDQARRAPGRLNSTGRRLLATNWLFTQSV